MSRKITKQYNEPDKKSICCLEKWYKVNILDESSIVWDNNSCILSKEAFTLIDPKKSFVEINWTAYDDIINALSDETLSENWEIDDLLGDTDYLENFRIVLINGRHKISDECKVYRVQKKVLIGFFKWKTETYYFIKDFYFSNLGNWFYLDDMKNGDIIDFKVKTTPNYNFSDHPPCILLYNQVEAKDENGEDIITIQTSNPIYVKNNYFEWSVENFADNLGNKLAWSEKGYADNSDNELIDNDKIGKPYALEIYYPTSGTADAGDMGGEDIEIGIWDGYCNDEQYGSAIVTYTLLTFDD